MKPITTSQPNFQGLAEATKGGDPEILSEANEFVETYLATLACLLQTEALAKAFVAGYLSGKQAEQDRYNYPGDEA